MHALFCDEFTLLKTTKSVNVEASELKKFTRSEMKIANLLKCKENNAAKSARSVNVRKTALLRLKRLIIVQQLSKSRYFRDRKIRYNKFKTRTVMRNTAPCFIIAM